MSEEDDAEEGPVVPLGDGEDVEGAPLARVVSRLHWGMSKGEIAEREGTTVIRTADGPQELGTILDDVETPYFESRREFTEAVRSQIGVGPIPSGELSEDTGTQNAAEETTEE